MRPRVFIGSSSEAIQVAKAVETLLQGTCDVTPWYQAGVFQLSQPYLSSLLEQLDRSEFAVLIFTADDVIELRDRKHRGPRDNVLFECGLFMGRLGPHRTLIISEKHDDQYVLSDLQGIARAEFRLSTKLEEATPEQLRKDLAKACRDVQVAMDERHGQITGDTAKRAFALVHPGREEYSTFFEGYTNEAAFLAYNPPFRIEAEAGDPRWEAALDVHRRRYENGVSSKYLFYEESSTVRATEFFAALKASIGRPDEIDQAIRIRRKFDSSRPQTTYFTGTRAGKPVCILYPTVFWESGRPRAVIVVEGDAELAKAFDMHFQKEWDEADDI